jgi:hypothetical protein
MCFEIFLLNVLGVVRNPPDGVLHKRNQNHGRERIGQSQSTAYYHPVPLTNSFNFALNISGCSMWMKCPQVVNSL